MNKCVTNVDSFTKDTPKKYFDEPPGYMHVQRGVSNHPLPITNFDIINLNLLKLSLFISLASCGVQNQLFNKLKFTLFNSTGTSPAGVLLSDIIHAGDVYHIQTLNVPNRSSYYIAPCMHTK